MKGLWIVFLFAMLIFLCIAFFAWLLPLLLSSGNEFLCILGVLIVLFVVVGLVVFICDKLFGGF